MEIDQPAELLSDRLAAEAATSAAALLSLSAAPAELPSTPRSRPQAAKKMKDGDHGKVHLAPCSAQPNSIAIALLIVCAVC